MLTAADKARLHAIFRITNPHEAPQLEEMGGSGVAVPPDFSRAVENIGSLVNRDEQSRGGLYVSRGFQTDREEFPRYDKGRMPVSLCVLWCLGAGGMGSICACPATLPPFRCLNF